MRNKMAMMMKAPDNFFASRKNMMINQCASMGCDAVQVKAFVDAIGIPEENVNWILNYKDNMNYRNSLKMM